MISTILILSISLFLFVLAGIIFQKSRKVQTDTKFLMATLICIGLANTAVGLNLDNLFFMVIMTSFLTLGFLFLFFHYEEISQPRPRLGVLIIMLGLYLLSLFFNLMIPFYMWLKELSFDMYYADLRLSEDLFIFTLFRMSKLLQSLIIFIVLTIAFFSVMKELRVIKIKAFVIESIGLLFLILYGSIYLIRDIFFYTNGYEILTSIALFISLIGLLLIISNYIMYPDYLYLLPFPVYNFMVFNEGGTSCYFRKVRTLEKMDSTTDVEHLLAGALNAVSTMFKEVLGAGANIRYIDADNFIILVTSLPDKKGVFVAITRGETALFKKSITRFANSWPSKLLDEINGMFELNELRPKIDALIKKSFPYVNF